VIAKQMTVAQLVEAHRLAREWTDTHPSSEEPDFDSLIHDALLSADALALWSTDRSFGSPLQFDHIQRSSG
jgi:hypothetical protein